MQMKIYLTPKTQCQEKGGGLSIYLSTYLYYCHVLTALTTAMSLVKLRRDEQIPFAFQHRNLYPDLPCASPVTF